MATTDIHAITGTVGQAIAYIMGDKVEGVAKDNIADSIAYAMNDKTGEVVYPTLTTTHNCTNADNPKEDFYLQMKRYGEREVLYGNQKTKDGKPILAWHLIQSFEGQVDPYVANEIGQKMARELFGNFPVVVSTHTNTENTHNHIMICAWDLDGTKWNQSNANYQLIRETSDRLCDEYGLSVLEETRKQKLIRWTDEDGKLHYYEPTDRKNDLIAKRAAGEITTDDVGSYRNSVPYEVTEQKKKSNVEIVKQSIDSLLPFATSYEHLLRMMREQGFTVKDKKKNGDWLSHIVFTPPTAERGVRDSSIDGSGYYTRVNLTKIIEAQIAEREQEQGRAVGTNIPFFETYEYGKIDVQSIDENFRAEKKPNGEVGYVRRGEAERSVIRDVKRSDTELRSVFDTYTLDRLIERQSEERKRNISPKNRNEVLVRQIQDGFENLRFMEQKQIYSYAQINETVKGLWQQYNACLVKISEAEGMIERLEMAAQLPQTLAALQKKIADGRNNPEYMMEQYHADLKMAQACMSNMKKYGVTDSASLKSLQEKVEQYREQIGRLQGALDAFAVELTAYNRCVANLSRIDRESGNDVRAELRDYETIVQSGQAEADSTNEKRKKKDRDR